MKSTTHFTGWNTASKSLAETIICALEAMKKNNYQVIIKYLPNEEQENPLMEPNKALNDPFAWKCTCQFHRSPEEMQEAVKQALNDTERDLLQNWTWIFGEPEAIELYKTQGICTPGLFKGIGTCSQVRKADLIKFLKENGEAERAELWEDPKQYFNSGIWSPIERAWQKSKDMTYAVYYHNNVEGLTTDELNELLDSSIRDIICKA